MTDGSVIIMEVLIQVYITNLWLYARVIHGGTKQWDISTTGYICKLCELTLNILRKWFDPGIHFNELYVIKNFIHLLHTFICC